MVISMKRCFFDLSSCKFLCICCSYTFEILSGKTSIFRVYERRCPKSGARILSSMSQHTLTLTSREIHRITCKNYRNAQKTSHILRFEKTALERTLTDHETVIIMHGLGRFIAFHCCLRPPYRATLFQCKTFMNMMGRFQALTPCLLGSPED